MKNAFELVREIEFNNLDKKSENFNNNILNIEKFILWVVGFSIGGIGLIISNIDKLKLNYKECDLKITLLFFIIALVFGILSRFSIHQFQVYTQVIDIFIRTQLSNYDFPELIADDISEEKNFYRIIDRFKLDFGLDYSRYLIDFDKFSIEHQQIQIDELKEKYKEIVNFNQKIFKDGQEYVREVYRQAYGFSERKSKKMFYVSQNKIANKFNLWKNLVDISFGICFLSFLTAVIILIIKF